MLILNTIRIMEKKSPQNFAYMDFAARDSHNSMSVLYYMLCVVLRKEIQAVLIHAYSLF